MPFVNTRCVDVVASQRQDFRSFRLDRIATLDVLEERFSDESGRALADFLRAVSTSGRER
jgi:predicted DNA-binding transcriptional regulator YafY